MRRAAPIIAVTGRIKELKIDSGKIEDPKTIIIAAPSAAPAETPIKPGSAKGFLNRPCREAPESPRLAPTKPAKMTLGMRISKITVFWSSFEEPLKISTNEELKLPREIATTKTKAIEVRKQHNKRNWKLFIYLKKGIEKGNL